MWVSLFHEPGIAAPADPQTWFQVASLPNPHWLNDLNDTFEANRKKHIFWLIIGH